MGDGEGLTRTIYEGPELGPRPLANFDDAARARILAAVNRALVLPSSCQGQFWRVTQDTCKLFASMCQLEAIAVPSVRQCRDARNAAMALKRALPPMLRCRDLAEPATFEATLFALTEMLIERIDTFYQPRDHRPQLNAGWLAIPNLGRVYKQGFGCNPSEAPKGPFARFVLTCLAETIGVPRSYTGEWVRKHVRRHRKQADPWSVAHLPGWDGSI